MILNRYVGNKSYTIGPGNIKTNLTCESRYIINITKLEVLNIATYCDKNQCNLSDEDRNYSNCDGISSCEVSLDNLSPCTMYLKNGIHQYKINMSE